MAALILVFKHPSPDGFSGRRPDGQAGVAAGQALVQDLLRLGPVEVSNTGVLLGFAWLDVAAGHVAGFGLLCGWFYWSGGAAESGSSAGLFAMNNNKGIERRDVGSKAGQQPRHGSAYIQFFNLDKHSNEEAAIDPS